MFSELIESFVQTFLGDVDVTAPEFGLAFVVALILLLVVREVVVVLNEGHYDQWLKRINLLLVPLLIVFVVILVLRSSFSLRVIEGAFLR